MNARVNAIDSLHRAVFVHECALMTDGQLLACFLEQQSQTAFEALVRRQGPMVLGVCRRILGNHQDAEDAFQATFLLLVRKASTVVHPELIGNWLFTVACRIAKEARIRLARRRSHEKQVSTMPEPSAEPEANWPQVQQFIDEELSHLPDKYRIPLVLCVLEGKSRQDAGKLLGLPEGTLSSRLATARKMLADRLHRRGLVLSAGTLAAFLSRETLSASVPPALVQATAQSAVAWLAGPTVIASVVSAEVTALVEGASKTMLLLQLKKIATLVAVLVGVLGAGAWMLAGARPEPTATVPDPIPAKPSAAPEKDDERTRALTILEKGIQAAKHCARLEKMSFKVEDGGVLATFELQGLDQARIKGGRPNENLDGCINGLACTLLGPRAGDIYLETNEKDWKKPFGNQLLVFKMRLYALRVAQTLEPLKDAKTFELSALGEYPINKRPALAIRAVNLKHKVRPDLELYFDKESGLLIQCRFQTKGPDAESGNELQFEDYQEIKGIKTFTRVRLKTEREFPFIRFPSTKDVDFELKEIKTPDKFDDETFEIPAEAKK